MYGYFIRRPAEASPEIQVTAETISAVMSELVPRAVA